MNTIMSSGGDGGGIGRAKPTPSESWAYLEAVRDVFKEQGKIENFQQFCRLIQEFLASKRRSEDCGTLVNNVIQLIKGHPPHLILGFNAFLPESYHITLVPPSPPPPQPPPAEFQQAITFLNKVRARFRSDWDDDQDADHAYNTLVDMINGIGLSKEKKKTDWTSSTSDAAADDDVEQLYHNVATLLQDHQDLLLEFTCFFPPPSDLPSAVKDPCSPSAALTPSYILLPKNYQPPLASQRRKLEDQVLNDRCVQDISSAQGNRSSSSSKQISEYEQVLFRCEDDRFELDMFMESVNSTTKRVQQLLQKIQTDAIEIDDIRIQDHLTVMNLRCIERLYGEWGLEVVDALSENVVVASQVILTRLKQKQQEWETCRSHLNQVWGQVYAKCLSTTNNNNQALAGSIAR